MSYARQMIEQLLPGVWDARLVLEAESPHAPDPEMPKAKPDIAKGNTKVAMLADIREAWDRAFLTLDQRRVLLLIYGFDMHAAEAAGYLPFTDMTVAVRRDEAIASIGFYLNGRALDN